jgi:hypothetical protein
MPRKYVLCIATATLLAPLAACGAGTSSPSPPTSQVQAATSAWASAPTAPPSDSPPGSRTCVLLAQAVERATLMDPGVVTAIQTASSTADAPVGDAAQRLATAYAAALAAHNTPQEPDATAAVSAAAADMAAVCNQSGLETNG